MRELECPYCKHDNEVPDECHEQEENYECTCAQCGDVFMFNVSYTPYYDTFKTPCLNDGKHDWKPIRGFCMPEEYYEKQRRCSYCGAETTTDRIAEGKYY